MAESSIIETLSIPSGAARPVRADLRSGAPAERRPLVIVTHGFLGYKRWGFFPSLSERLADEGFHVLTMSFSMNGVDEQTGRITHADEFAFNTVRQEVLDLRAVCTHALSGGLPIPVECERAGLLAHSRGAAVAILTAGQFPGIRSLVTWATPSRLDRYSERRKRLWKEQGELVFHDERADVPMRLDYSYYEDIARNREAYDLPAAAARLSMPHLMIHGERDAAVTVGEMAQLYPEGLPESARCEIIPGCSHTFGITHPMRKSTRAFELALSHSASWLGETLKIQSTEESTCRETG